MWNFYTIDILLITPEDFNPKKQNSMKNVLILFATLLITGLAYCQNYGEIQGKVVDENGEGLPGVNVYSTSSSGDMATTTDVHGKFRLKPLNPGVYTLELSFIGYNTQKITGINVDPDKIKFLKTSALDVTENMIPDILIVEYVDKLIDPEETSRVTIRTADIKTNALRTSPMDMIATMKSDIKRGTDGELYFRGSRSGAVQYNIDGVKMTTDVQRIPSSAIGSISVYTGGMPAKYGDTTGGVVVIETRSYMDLYNASLR